MLAEFGVSFGAPNDTCAQAARFLAARRYQYSISIIMLPLGTSCPRASHMLAQGCKISFVRSSRVLTHFYRQPYSPTAQSQGSQACIPQARILSATYLQRFGRQRNIRCYAASTLVAEPDRADDGKCQYSSQLWVVSLSHLLKYCQTSFELPLCCFQLQRQFCWMCLA